MSDAFNVELPQWAQRMATPVDMRGAGAALGRAAGVYGSAAIRYGREKLNGEQANFANDVYEAKRFDEDPLWKLKQSRYEAQTAQLLAGVNSEIVSNRLKQQQVLNTQSDTATFSAIMSDVSDDPASMLDKVIRFAPTSTQGVQMKNSAINALRSGVAYRANQQVLTKGVDTLNKITPFVGPDDAATFSQTMQSFATGRPDWAGYQALVTKHGDKLSAANGETALQKNSEYTQKLLQDVEDLTQQASDARDAGDEAAAVDFETQAKIKQDSIPQTTSQKVAATADRIKTKAEQDKEMATINQSHRMSLRQVSVLSTQVEGMRRELRALEKPDSGANPTTLKNLREDLRRKQADLDSRLNGTAQEPAAASPAAAPTPAKSKADIANDLAAKNPTWTRQQVIDAVNAIGQ